MGRILFGFIVGLVCIPGAAYLLFHNAKAPVAVADPPFPYEREIAGKFLHDRISREMIQIPPLQPDEHTLVEGAHIYNEKCAVCHGLHGKPSTIGENMFPAAPPLWEKHRNGPAVGVSDDLPGETYWKVANGIRLSGMPEYRSQLTNTELWEVSLLLANADKPLPPEALTILRGEAPAAAAARGKGASTAQPQSTTLDE
jgi:mono/diheme cytochrome c family protein